ncbi:MAG TPA: TetR/AcrR family transcriptional regulator [Thermoleophilaceae bacterium]
MGRLMAESPALSGRREERKARNREKLLLAARRVFAEKGLGEATARDIVRETDLATGTFYNYFTSKDDAFRALLGEFAGRARAAARAQRRDPEASLDERIFNAYRSYFELAIEDAELFAVLRRNAGVIAMMTDDDMFEVGTEELFEDLMDWARDGDLPGVDLHYLATAMVGTGFQVAAHLADRRPPDVDGAARFCTRLFLGGIRELGAG